METFVARNALTKLCSIIPPEYVTDYVHDRDNKSKTVVKEVFPNVRENLDPGHCKKGFDVYWNKPITKGYGDVAGRIFYGIKNRLHSFYKYLIGDKSITREQKYLHWQNALNHLIGQHNELCMHHYQKKSQNMAARG